MLLVTIVTLPVTIVTRSIPVGWDGDMRSVAPDTTMESSPLALSESAQRVGYRPSHSCMQALRGRHFTILLVKSDRPYVWPWQLERNQQSESHH